MNASAYIAWRYLFSRKRRNAINIVSGVSAAAVAVVTAAMVCILSVMNGFGSVVSKMFSQFDPDLQIVAASSPTFMATGDVFEELQDLSYVTLFSESIEQTALVEFAGRQLPAQVRGVDDSFQALTAIDSILVDGTYSVYDGAFERCVLGQGLAAQLGIGAHFVHGLHLYAPFRTDKINTLRPDESFHQTTCFISGIFAVNQVEYDDRLMLISLPLAQRLFGFRPHEVTSLSLRIAADYPLRRAEREIQQLLGKDYRVLNRYEQQADFYRILRIEKLLTGILLAFILLIASFNVIGSLTMLLIDKQADIQTLRHLGADSTFLRRTFLYAGWLITLLGAAVGMVIGIGLCFVQQHYGLIKLGSGTEYVISAYPVVMEASDLLLVAMLVLSIGWLAAWWPTRSLSEVK